MKFRCRAVAQRALCHRNLGCLKQATKSLLLIVVHDENGKLRGLMRSSKQTEGSNVAFEYVITCDKLERIATLIDVKTRYNFLTISSKIKHTFCKLLGLSCVLSIILMATFWTGKYKT